MDWVCPPNLPGGRKKGNGFGKNGPRFGIDRRAFVCKIPHRFGLNSAIY